MFSLTYCMNIAVLITRNWQTYPTTGSNVHQRRESEPRPTLCSVMYDEESVNRSQIDIKRKTCDIRTKKNNIYFSTYPPPALIHLSRRFTSASKPAV
jgi:hypothetical protein